MDARLDEVGSNPTAPVSLASFVATLSEDRAPVARLSQIEAGVLNAVEHGMTKRSLVKTMHPVFDRLLARGLIEPYYQLSKAGEKAMRSCELSEGRWVPKRRKAK